MGYYTTFEIESNDYKTSEHIENIKTLSKYSCFDDVKWYEHEKDMKAYSLLHPTVLFTVGWDGEEQGDTGVRYFKNGKMQVCKAIITCDPFNELLLK